MKIVIFICILFASCSHKFYKPYVGPYAENPEFVESVTFQTEDNHQLKGFLLKSQKPSKGIVIHFHGNTGNAQTYFIFVEWLIARGYDVFTFDYRGYGESQGSPSRSGLVKDSRAAIKYITDQRKWDNIYLFGQSLGGNQAIAVVDDSNRHFIDGMIIDSTFYSYASVANYHVGDSSLFYPFTWMLVGGNSYSAADYVKSLHVPIMFIHGDKDEMVPISHSYQLFQESSFPKSFIGAVNCGHVEALAREPIRDAIVQFLESNSLEFQYIRESTDPEYKKPPSENQN
ncbi:alpha/beta fold hydrolase [Candidatus Uabimicrobium helgolandensis]